jgi:hypothetical protein
MKHLILLVLFLTGISGIAISSSPDAINQIYTKLGTDRPSLEIFTKAFEGYGKIENMHAINPDKSILTIIDLDLPSSEKRLWVIDLKQNKILFHTYVAHGRNSGDLYAEKFSNISGSYQSSLGFYITGDTYQGKNGFSMYLDGLEQEFNHLARERAIVMHGAWYATEDFIKKNGRLGRSFGCPAVPPEVHEALIDTISGGTVLFMFREEENYLQASLMLSR